ncbi:MAG: anion permease [Melioribacteraceae bacterium]|nr:anion permease [Melioribacteraceae bacterium]
MDKIQIALFFVSGFFTSRLVIKYKIPEVIMDYLFSEKHYSASKILLHLIFLASLLSFFIPNVIAVLTLLPLINLILKSYEGTTTEIRKMATMLSLGVMYGANIGGMGSVTATPANGILVTFLLFKDVAGSESITFSTWLIWGIPLVVVFSFTSWFLLLVFFQPRKAKLHLKDLIIETPETRGIKFKLTIALTFLYFISSLILSAIMIYETGNQTMILVLTGIFTLIFSLFLFIVPIKNGKGNTVLLKIKDCFTDLPKKGFLFVGISILIALILYALNIQADFSQFVNKILPKELPVFTILFLLAIITTFSTELISNTAVQLSLFLIIGSMANLIGFATIEGMIIITLSSTCAFMSPIATGVNGLAFGGVPNVSLSRMLIAGFFMNILGAILITLWITQVASLTF